MSTTESSAGIRAQAKGARRHRDGGRRLAAWITLALIAVGLLLVWGMRRADELPDIGDPFAVAQALKPVPVADADNAYVVYAEAKRQHPAFPAPLKALEFNSVPWSKASAVARDFVEKNRLALETWRAGTALPDAIHTQPSDMRVGTVLRDLEEMWTMSYLAGLLGSRLEEEGKVDQSWTWYLAMLRASRHVGMRGFMVERGFGAQMHAEAAARILRWQADPRVDAALLRRALDDTLAADALTPPLSRCLKFSYLSVMREIDEMTIFGLSAPLPGGKEGLVERYVGGTSWKAPIQRFRHRLSNDVERSRRAVRLLFANWLAQIDKPAGQRAPVAIETPLLIYRFDPGSTAARAGVDAQMLDRALTHTAIAREMFRPDQAGPSQGWPVTMWEGTSPLAREPRHRTVLIVALAAELYRRERRRPPPNVGALLGTYLPALPEGIAANDPVPAKLD